MNTFGFPPLFSDRTHSKWNSLVSESEKAVQEENYEAAIKLFSELMTLEEKEPVVCRLLPIEATKYDRFRCRYGIILVI